MIIHRFWTGPAHPMEAFTARAIRTTHPGKTLCEWTHEDVADDELLGGDARHASNVLRYQVLLEHGGLWLDHDVLPLTDLTKVSAHPWVASIGGRYEGCAMFFPEKGHPALKVLLEKARWPEAGRLSTPIRSGAYLLNEVLRQWPEVRMEPGVLPFDAAGQRQWGSETLAVHLWDTSSRQPVQANQVEEQTAELGYKPPCMNMDCDGTCGRH